METKTQKDSFYLHGDHIIINRKCGNSNQKRITLKANVDFLDDYVIIECSDDYICIKRIGIDYNGKTYKLSKGHSEWRGATIAAELPLGKFMFDDEESNEDQLIAYFN